MVFGDSRTEAELSYREMTTRVEIAALWNDEIFERTRASYGKMQVKLDDLEVRVGCDHHEQIWDEI